MFKLKPINIIQMSTFRKNTTDLTMDNIRCIRVLIPG